MGFAKKPVKKTAKKPKVSIKVHKPKTVVKKTTTPKKVVTKTVKKPVVKKVVKKVVPKKAVVKVHGVKQVVKCKISKNMRCGPKHDNTRCPFGFCSKWGWCGVSKLHKQTHQVLFDASPACKAQKKLII